MAGKIPLSVRISQDDAAFLAGLAVTGATSPSDKLRALIRDARLRHEGCHGYGECFAIQQQSWAPFIQRLREAEMAAGIHSELLIQLTHWLADIKAFLMASETESDSEAALRSMESAAADRVFTLFELILRMAVTKSNPCYDPSAINKRLGPILELSNLIQSSGNKEREKNDDQ